MKGIKVFLIFIFLLSFAGCATVKGAFEGATEDAQVVGKGASYAWATFKKADDWVKENLW